MTCHHNCTLKHMASCTLQMSAERHHPTSHPTKTVTPHATTYLIQVRPKLRILTRLCLGLQVDTCLLGCFLGRCLGVGCNPNSAFGFVVLHHLSLLLSHLFGFLDAKSVVEESESFIDREALWGSRVSKCIVVRSKIITYWFRDSRSTQAQGR